jgi:hypothetical protein
MKSRVSAYKDEKVNMKNPFEMIIKNNFPPPEQDD